MTDLKLMNHLIISQIHEHFYYEINSVKSVELGFFPLPNKEKTHDSNTRVKASVLYHNHLLSLRFQHSRH